MLTVNSQGGVKFPTGGMFKVTCNSNEPASALFNLFLQLSKGQADLVRCQSRRLQSGWKRIWLIILIPILLKTRSLYRV